jgi:glutamate dehydrogenase
VLANNYRQVQAISIAEREARERGGEYRRLIGTLVESGRLDRDLEFLPSDEELADRRVHGKALTRPELSVLVSYSKAILKEELIASDLGLDPYVAGAVATAFPAQLVATYPEDIAEHRLRREIMCTQVANDIVNRMGLNFVMRQQKATGAPVADVARAYTASMGIFGLTSLWDAIEALDFKVSADLQIEMMLDIIRLVKRSTRWLLRNRRHQLAPTDLIEEFRSGVDQLRQSLPELLRGRAAELYAAQCERYVQGGVPQAIAEIVAWGMHAPTGLAIADVSSRTGSDLLEVATLYYHLGERLELDWFGDQILASKVENEWQAMAREAYLEDLQWQQCTLAKGVLRLRCDNPDLVACISAWEEQEAALLSRWRQMVSDLHATTSPDFAMFAVANRELLDLAQSSAREDE